MAPISGATVMGIRW